MPPPFSPPRGFHLYGPRRHAATGRAVARATREARMLPVRRQQLARAVLSTLGRKGHRSLQQMRAYSALVRAGVHVRDFAGWVLRGDADDLDTVQEALRLARQAAM